MPRAGLHGRRHTAPLLHSLPVLPALPAEGAALTFGPGGTGMAGPGQRRATTEQVARASRRARGRDAQPARAGLSAREETRPGT